MMSDEQLSDLQDAQEKRLPEPLPQLFSQLRPFDVEQFANAYQIWTLYQQIDLLTLQIARTREELQSNEELMHLVQPTALELSTLAQLQSLGVSDINLLDRLHARGEVWLDHAMQLLEHCERMDLIQGDYTQWCEHALEGAYDWLSSIDEDDLTNAEKRIEQPVASEQEKTETDDNNYDEQTEVLLLRKLLSETDENLPEETDVELTSPVTASKEEAEEEIPAEAVLANQEDNAEVYSTDETASATILPPPAVEQQDNEQKNHPEIAQNTMPELEAPEANKETLENILQEEPAAYEDMLVDHDKTDKYLILVPEQVPHPAETDEATSKAETLQTSLSSAEESAVATTTISHTIPSDTTAPGECNNITPTETLPDTDDEIAGNKTTSDELAISHPQAGAEKQKPLLPKKRGSFLHRLLKRFFRFLLK